jgi:NAD(P)-dependent dehydrogenase (short-subunit alcohol dehydrogenase family)
MADPAPRIAAVTGASSGIGRAIATALGHLGWRVALGSRRVDALAATADLVRDAGGEPFVHALDVTDPASVDAFFDATDAALGPVDALVNNAGMAAPGPFATSDPVDLQREITTNLVGPFLCSRRALRAMLPAARGDLVFISSDTSHAPRPGMLGYSASKGGLEVGVRVLTLELEGSGVRTGIVRVGPTITDFAAEWDGDRLAQMMEYWPRFGIQRHFNTMDPTDVARAVVFVLTQPAGMHVDSVEVQPQAPIEPR